MTVATQGNKILQLVISEGTAKPDVMNVELSRASTLLASPPISLEDLLAKRSVGIGLEFQSRAPLPD